MDRTLALLMTAAVGGAVAAATIATRQRCAGVPTLKVDEPKAGPDERDGALAPHREPEYPDGMPQRPNRLLLPGSHHAWARIAPVERQGPSGTVEELLRRGQVLSAQAAALRRAVGDGPAARA